MAIIGKVLKKILKTPSVGNPSFLELLILQPTPFCNLDCTYCYLPDRDSNKRMPIEVVATAVRKVIASGVVKNNLRVLWHAGEPMAVGLDFYEKAFAVIKKTVEECGGGISIAHSIQTNATLINDKWCEFFKRENVEVGVSVDGPDFLHDKYRKLRNGKGSFIMTMKGIEKLRQNNVAFSTISVLTDTALDYPDEIFEFFKELSPIEVGFNVDEQEGINTNSTLSGERSIARYSSFISRLYDLNVASDKKLKIREIENRIKAIFGFNDYNTQVMEYLGAQENAPYRILNVDCEGNFSTFSPELLGMQIRPYGKFVLGNLITEEIGQSAKTDKFKRISKDIQKGVKKCAEECEYFGVCGGGAPANKYYENGSFATSETLRCKLQIQAVSEVLLQKFQETQGNKAASAPGPAVGPT